MSEPARTSVDSGGDGSPSGTVILKPGKDGPLRAGHPWVYSGAIKDHRGDASAGAPVQVLGDDGSVLGMGTFNPHGAIAVRMFARDAVVLDARFLNARIADAFALRQRLGVTENTGYRLINGEGDSLPGVVIDVFGEFVVAQILTAGAERLREAILQAIDTTLSPRGIFERSSGGVRREERLEDRVGVAAGEEPPEEIEIVEGGARFVADIRGGQKTGFYFDQRANRALIGRLARGRRVLNGFSYTGGFGVTAALGGAERVVSVETSGPALRLARATWERNGLPEASVEWVARDMFDYLAAAASTTERFDLIVLDPPPFARHRGDKDRAARGYRDLNRRALKLLRPGGLLATFSCSAHFPRDHFEHVIATSGAGSSRLQVLARLGADVDHPVLAAHTEGEYLKGVLVRVAGD